MPAKRLSMRKIKEVLRLFWACKHSQRQIARQCGNSRHCVSKYLRRAKQAELSWLLPEQLDDAQLERLLFPPPPPSMTQRTIPDWDDVFLELKKKNVTKLLLWQEYHALNPMGYNYRWFCSNYRRWLGTRDLWTLNFRTNN